MNKPVLGEVALAVLLVSLAALADRGEHPAGSPTVEVSQPNYEYAATPTSLKAIDFRNFGYAVYNRQTKRKVVAKLRDGLYESRWSPESGSDWLRFEWAGFPNENSNYAVVALSWVATGASADDLGVVQVLTIRDGHPRVVQQMLFNRRGCGAQSSLGADSRTLTIKGIHGWEHCCPTTLDVVRYGWTGSSFQQQALETAPIPDKC